MGRHAVPDDADDVSEVVPADAEPVRGARPEPVAIAAAAQAVLAALVALGWANLDDATINIIGTAIAAVLSVVFTWIARSRVTPVSDPVIPQQEEGE
jgi:hypothetical protein